MRKIQMSGLLLFISSALGFWLGNDTWMAVYFALILISAALCLLGAE